MVLAFGLLLVVGVLISERARQTVLSTSVLFLLGGIVLGRTGLHWLHVDTASALVGGAAEVSLFVILFVDGAQLTAQEIAEAWELPGRALLFGLPLTIAATALAARWVLGLGWVSAFLVGSVLGPTDPVLVRAILEHEAVPVRLRRLLTVESGLNDGLALPAIVVLIAVARGGESHPWIAMLDAVAGLGLGIGIAAISVLLGRMPWFGVSRSYRPLAGVSIALTVFGASRLLGTNEFLAAFAAGITFATMHANLARSLVVLGEPISEALKLGSLLVFGAALSLSLDWRIVLFTALALLAARPLALFASFLGGELDRKEWIAAAWFGPKGFASLLYGVLVARAGIANGHYLYDVIGFVIAVSVLAHSSTDSVVARTFRQAEAERSSSDSSSTSRTTPASGNAL